MLKFFGILTIIAVSTLYGLRASTNLKLRRKRLGLYLRLIGEIEDKIRLRKGLDEIFSEGLAVELIQYENFSATFKKEGLKQSDIDILNEFFSLLGLGDIKSQTELCKTYLGLLGKKEKEAEAETSQKAKLYSLLGFSFGLFVAIMLI